MADWNNPTITTQYDVWVAEAKDRDNDAATMFLTASTNQPIGSIRYNRSSDTFQEWDGALWNDILISVAGSGTGATTAAGARTALGIGTLGLQNSNAIAVTGGTITGLTQLDLNVGLTFATDATYDLATFAKQVRKGYFKDALVIPVGTDKYATS